MSKKRQAGDFMENTDYSEIESAGSVYNLDPKYIDHHKISN